MYARLGRFTYRRRRLIVGAWMVLLVAGVAIGSNVMTRMSTEMHGAAGSDSVAVHQVVHELRSHVTQVVAVVDDADVEDRHVQTQVEAATADIRRLRGVSTVLDRYSFPMAELTATDGRGSLVVVILDADLDHHERHRITVAARNRLKEITAATVNVSGPSLLDEEFAGAIERDLRKGESIALPVAFVAMVFIFGGVVVAGLPLLVAMVTVAATMLLLLALTYVSDVSAYAMNVVFMLGIGLGIDYGLLLVSRMREEKAAGLHVGAAIERTVATAGRTVVFSALTVAVALSSLFAFGDPMFTSFAVAGIGVVLLSMAASITFLPALLGIAWKRIRPGQPAADGGGFFYRLATVVQRRALPVAALVAVALLAVGAPFLGARFENGDARSLPPSSEARAVAIATEERFPTRGADPIYVVADAAQEDPQLIRYMAELGTKDGVASVTSWSDDAEETTVVEVVPEGTSQGDTAQRLVRELRNDPPTFDAKVGGTAAFLIDMKRSIGSRLGAALAVIVGATFVLLFFMTGSVVVPAKAIVMNVLSLGATFGALVWVFQLGHLSNVLAFEPVGSLDLVMPVLIFIFAFGLSMDYEVFLLARIKEAYDETGDNDLSVRLGLQRSGRIVTSAALLIVVVFAGFASGEVLLVKQLGLGLALAVVVDATIVRSVLVPATMRLLGARNWWAPAPLRRLHDRFGISEADVAPVARVAVGVDSH
jgi:RND superfamily putative drug exporter